MTDIENAIEAITQQQSKLQKNSAPFFVGEQLKDILRGTPSAAGIVLQDLKTAGMGIADCEKKIADFASKHRAGSTGCCPPMEADRIIREFYGIPAESALHFDQSAITAKAGQITVQKARKVSLADFL